VNQGTQPDEPAVVNCWDTFVFNTMTCVWDNTGTSIGDADCDGVPTELDCDDNDDEITITIDDPDCMGLNIQSEDLSDIQIYPNPTFNILKLKGNLSLIRSVEIYTLTGQLVKRTTDNFEVIDLTSLESAIYIIKLKSEKGFKNLKVIKE
jgi:hypothetical protein